MQALTTITVLISFYACCIVLNLSILVGQFKTFHLVFNTIPLYILHYVPNKKYRVSELSKVTAHRDFDILRYINTILLTYFHVHGLVCIL